MNSIPEDNLLLAIIANSIFPYGYDAVRILSVPRNSTYRARFDEKFVSDQVRRDFRHLGRANGYYCFRDYGSNRLIPLRMLEVVEVTLIGSVYYIEYALKDIFDFPQNESTLNEQISQFNVQFSGLHKNEMKEYVSGGDLRPLVLMSRLHPAFHAEVETITNDYDKQTRRWAAITKLLGGYEYFKYVPFIRVIGIRNAASNSIIKTTDGGFVLNSNEDYRLQIAHNLQSDSATPHSINEARTDRQVGFIQRASFQLELRGDPNVLEIQEPRVFITGAYDVNYFYFRTRDFLAGRSTTLTIDYTEKPAPIKNVDTKTSLGVALRPQTRFPLYKLLLLVGLIVVYAIPNLYPVVFQTLGDPRVLQDISIIAICLTAFDLIGELRRYLAS